MRIIDFSDGFTSSSAPSTSGVSLSGFETYANDAAYVAANGTATGGDCYYNTTDDVIRLYADGSWITIPDNTTTVNLTGDQSIAGNKTFDDNVIITGNLTVNGTTVTLNTTTLDVEDVNITVNDGGNQTSADGNAGLTVEMSDATDVVLLYDSSLTSRFKIGDSGSEVEIVTVSGAQSVTNKDIDGGTASNTSRLTVPKNTKTNLDGLTRKEGTLVYATDEEKPYIDNGTDLIEISGGGAGDADTIHLVNADDLSSVGDVDLSGNNADFDGGGTITSSSLSISETAADLIAGDSVIKYDPDADGSDDYFGFTKAIPIGLRGRELGFSFEYKNDSTTVDNDFRFCVKQKDGVNAGNVEYFNMKAFYNSDGNSDKFPVGSFIASDCTEVEFGWQNTSTTTTVELYVDKILISSDPFVYKDLYNTTEWTSYTPSFNGFGTATNVDFYWRRDGSDLLIRGNFTSGTPTAAEARADLPTGLTSSSNISTLEIAGVLAQDSNGDGDYSVLSEPSQTYVTFGRARTSVSGLDKINGDALTGAGASISFIARVPIEGWANTTEHVVTPAKVENPTEKFLTADVSSTGDISDLTFNDLEIGSWYEVTGNITTSTNSNAVDIRFYSGSSGSGTLYQRKYFDTAPSGTIWQTDLSSFKFKAVSTSMYVNVVAIGGTLIYGNSSKAETFVQVQKQTPQFLAAIPTQKVVYIKDVKSSGTNGDTFTSGAWQTRDLNTVTGDSEIVSLNSNQFTLQAGKYDTLFRAVGVQVNVHQVKIYNITDSVDVGLGVQVWAGAAESVGNISSGSVGFTISKETTFELQHRCQTTSATNGLGAAHSFGDEVYAEVKITKIK